MALIQPDRNFSASASARGDDGESLAYLLHDKSDLSDLLDETIRVRFGKIITEAMRKPRRR
jgi:hypothetical protein